MKAARGMFALIERRHSYTTQHGADEEYLGYTPAIVSRVTREGIVKAARILGQSLPLKHSDWQYIGLDFTRRIADPERVVALLADENGNAIEFKDRIEALTAIQKAAGIAPMGKG